MRGNEDRPGKNSGDSYHTPGKGHLRFGDAGSPGYTRVPRAFVGLRRTQGVCHNEVFQTAPFRLRDGEKDEQWGVCLEGEWIRVQDGVEHHVRAGDFWQTPPNVPHGGRTLDQRCVVLDIFAPPREEYRQAGEGFGKTSLVG